MACLILRAPAILLLLSGAALGQTASAPPAPVEPTPPSVVADGGIPSDAVAAPAPASTSLAIDAGVGPAAPKLGFPKPALRGVIGAVGSLGSAPAVAPGVDVHLDLRWDKFSLGFGGRGDASVGATIKGAALQTAIVAGELVPCARQKMFGECAVLAIGELSASIPSSASGAQGSSAFVALGARGLVDYPLSRSFSFEGALEITAPLTGNSVAVNGTSLWKVSPVDGALELFIVFAIE